MDGDGDNKNEIREESNYYPFGLKHKGYNNVITGRDHKYGFGGKELNDELGLNWHDFGWRNYDATTAKWMNIDNLAEKIYSFSPYNYVQNSPLLRIDPDGLTDYKINRKTGAVEQVGDANDDPDRVLKSNRKGKVKYKKNGNAKVAFGDIEKGILKDGQNLKEGGTAIEVGGKGQPTEKGVEAFALRLSGYVGTEIGGAYLSLGDSKNTTHITIGGYTKNDFQNTKSYGLSAFRDYVSSVEEFTSSIKGFFHTHPGDGGQISNSDRLVPSNPDVNTRDAALKLNPSLRFFLITRPVNGGSFPLKIDYTKGYIKRY